MQVTHHVPADRWKSNHSPQTASCAIVSCFGTYLCPYRRSSSETHRPERNYANVHERHIPTHAHVVRAPHHRDAGRINRVIEYHDMFGASPVWHNRMLIFSVFLHATALAMCTSGTDTRTPPACLEKGGCDLLNTFGFLHAEAELSAP